ncbi:MAG: hypothetical protein Q9M36_06475 [Sulfurovum sp.]|nr:hypothetical protein [Sulfurovum sp.]
MRVKTMLIALEKNTSVKGEVSIASHQDDWYKIVIPKGQNRLTLSLSQMMRV